jgi:hypothetical protein
MTFLEFLRYASGPGVNAVVGFLLAFALELAPAFESYPPRQKRLLTMGLCFVVPLLAALGLIAYGDIGLATWRDVVDVVWLAAGAGFAAFFGSQGGHALMLPADRAATQGRPYTIN